MIKLLKVMLLTPTGRAILIGICGLFLAGIMIGLCIAHGSWVPMVIDIICVYFIFRTLIDIVLFYGRRKYNEKDLTDITW